MNQSEFLRMSWALRAEGISSTGCWDRLLVCGMFSTVQPFRGHTENRDRSVTRIDFIITMAMCFPTQERGPDPNGWKKRLGTFSHTVQRETWLHHSKNVLYSMTILPRRHQNDYCFKKKSILWCFECPCRHSSTHIFLKVVQTELVWFGVELGSVHAACV